MALLKGLIDTSIFLDFPEISVNVATVRLILSGEHAGAIIYDIQAREPCSAGVMKLIRWTDPRTLLRAMACYPVALPVLGANLCCLLRLPVFIIFIVFIVDPVGCLQKPSGPPPM